MSLGTLLLLPPSEGKRSGGAGSFEPGSGQFPALGEARRQVAVALAAAMADPTTAAAVTGLRGERATVAATANRAVLGSPTLAAAERYTGVVWSHLDPASLGRRARRRADGVLVVSALGGLFALGDPVPNYKLRMAARLPGLGPLAAFWREQLRAVLHAATAGRAVWDLLPAEHRKAVDLDGCISSERVRVEFRAAGGAKAAGHAAKAAKGRFVRHLLEAARPGLDAAAAFRWEGWQGEVQEPDLVVVHAPA